ncbi:MAG: hypothetical protein K5681_07680 [Treponema sp.]|nr:hypothetical protein [Treponema sp.]
MICWKCRKETNIVKPLRGDECPHCHADLHACRACDFYESGSHNDCRESSAEFVKDKERSNFCDYFRSSKLEAAAASSGGEPAGKSKADAARDAFNALFG